MNLFEYIVGSRMANREQRHLATLLTRQFEMEHPEVVQALQAERRRRTLTWLIVLAFFAGLVYVTRVRSPSARLVTFPTPAPTVHAAKKKRPRRPVPRPEPSPEPEVSPEAPQQ